MASPNHKTSSLLYWLCLVGACAILYGRFVIGAIPVGADLTLVYAPFFSMRWDGGVPLWDAFTLSGVPLADNLQAALYYPPRWPFYFISDWRSYFGLFHFLHHLLAMAGMGIFLRALGLRRSATLVGAIVFGAGGHMAGRIINPTIFYACAWLPLLLCGGLDHGRQDRWLATGALTMIFLIGSPHLILFGTGSYLLTVLILGGSLKPSRGNRAETDAPGKESGERQTTLKVRLVRALCHVGLSVVIGAPAFVPGLLRAGESVRTLAEVDVNLSDSVGFGEILPIFLGGTGGAIYPEYIDKTCYVGPIVLLLVLCLAFRRASWRDRRFLFALALFACGLLFALGRNVGLQFVMPYIPVFRRLAGPARAVVLCAAAMGLLAALAVEWLSCAARQPNDHEENTGDAETPGHVSLWARPVFRFALASFTLGSACLAMACWRTWTASTSGGTAPFADEWFTAWAVGPGALGRGLFLWFDGAIGLMLAGCVSLLAISRPRLLTPGLAAIIFFQLWHFYPRVAPPTEPASTFDPTPQVQFLQTQQFTSAPEPFRIVGYEPMRLHDCDFPERGKYKFLMPSMATLHGLEDINGFDPLIPLRYLDLVQATSGRSVVNDPIRNLEIAQPDTDLFDTLNVRYLIGHPYDRRLTPFPMQLNGRGSSESIVEAWDDNGPAEPITDYLFVSLQDRTQFLPPGTEIGRLEIEAEEGDFSYPVRTGIETAHVRATGYEEYLRSPGFRAKVQGEWSMHVPDPASGYRMWMANYRGRIAFGRPLHVKKVRWRVTRSDAVLYIACQGYRLARPAETDDPWRLAFGSENDLAPVFEYRNATPRAMLVASGGVSRDAVSGNVAWVERRTNSMRLRVQADGPARLLLREMWFAGWRARVDGRAQPVERVDGVLMAIPVPPGESDIVLTYRPTVPLLLLGLSVLVLCCIAGRVIWGVVEIKKTRAAS